jgi:hypothetical protein
MCRFAAEIRRRLPAADLSPLLGPRSGPRGTLRNGAKRGLDPKEAGTEIDNYEEEIMSLGTILLIVLILMLIGVIPTWPHSRSWGYWPSGALGVIVLIIIILLVTGRL